jgi:hypothetical protein
LFLSKKFIKIYYWPVTPAHFFCLKKKNSDWKIKKQMLKLINEDNYPNLRGAKILKFISTEYGNYPQLKIKEVSSTPGHLCIQFTEAFYNAIIVLDNVIEKEIDKEREIISFMSLFHKSNETKKSSQNETILLQEKKKEEKSTTTKIMEKMLTTFMTQQPETKKEEKKEEEKKEEEYEIVSTSPILIITGKEFKKVYFEENQFTIISQKGKIEVFEYNRETYQWSSKRQDVMITMKNQENIEIKNVTYVAKLGILVWTEIIKENEKMTGFLKFKKMNENQIKIYKILELVIPNNKKMIEERRILFDSILGNFSFLKI